MKKYMWVNHKEAGYHLYREGVLVAHLFRRQGEWFCEHKTETRYVDLRVIISKMNELNKP